jgi:hypothetical protein
VKGNTALIIVYTETESAEYWLFLTSLLETIKDLNRTTEFRKT